MADQSKAGEPHEELIKVLDHGPHDGSRPRTIFDIPASKLALATDSDLDDMGPDSVGDEEEEEDDPTEKESRGRSQESGDESESSASYGPSTDRDSVASGEAYLQSESEAYSQNDELTIDDSKFPAEWDSASDSDESTKSGGQSEKPDHDYKSHSQNFQADGEKCVSSDVDSEVKELKNRKGKATDSASRKISTVMNQDSEAEMDEDQKEDDGREPGCRICFESVKNKVVISECSHAFCRECLARWIQDGEGCPICKISFESVIVKEIAGSEAKRDTRVS